jgi:hypothetical protein
MKQVIFKTIAFAGALMISGAAFTASAGERLRVNVPFSFMVGNTQFAAGEYRIEASDNGLLTLQGEKSAAMVLTTPAEMTKSGTTGLRFTSNNSHAYLTTVQVEGEAARELSFSGPTHKLTMTGAH